MLDDVGFARLLKARRYRVGFRLRPTAGTVVQNLARGVLGQYQKHSGGSRGPALAGDSARPPGLRPALDAIAGAGARGGERGGRAG